MAKTQAKTVANQRGKIRKPSQERGEATRLRILQTAVLEFAAHGFEGASIRRIALSVGENVGLIPYYFVNKENLWKAAVTFHFQRLALYLKESNETLSELPPKTRIRENLKSFVRFAARHPEQMRIMVHEGQFHGERMRWLTQTHLKPLYENFQRMAERAVELKMIPTAPPAHFYYTYLGATSNIYTAASECQAVTGTDPFADKSVEAHAEFVCTLLYGPDTGK